MLWRPRNGDFEPLCQTGKKWFISTSTTPRSERMSGRSESLGQCQKTLPAITQLLEEQTYKWNAEFEDQTWKRDRKVINPELHPKTPYLKMGEVGKVSEAVHLRRCSSGNRCRTEPDDGRQIFQIQTDTQRGYFRRIRTMGFGLCRHRHKVSTGPAGMLLYWRRRFADDYPRGLGTIIQEHPEHQRSSCSTTPFSGWFVNGGICSLSTLLVCRSGQSNSRKSPKLTEFGARWANVKNSMGY